MKRNGAARFFLLVLAGLGVLTWAAHAALVSTTRSWFERDVQLRARLAVASAEMSLLSAWRAGDADALAAILAGITRDERIMGAAICPTRGALAVATPGYPAEFTCNVISDRARKHTRDEDEAGGWSFSAELAGGPVHLSIHPIRVGTELGSVVLVHDLGYVTRREGTTRNQALAGFFVLAACASVMTVLAARFAWRHWLGELREALAGRASREFQPLVRHMRELVERLSQEAETEANVGRWTPERLKDILRRHLRGERIVLLANREPYIHEHDASGAIRVLHPASGLVTALEPVMRACSGTWVAHGAGSADRETVDADDRVRVPPGEESYSIRRVWLSAMEEAGYYYGFSNEGLWPLCHIAHARPTFRADDFAHYKEANARFARAVCDEVDIEDPIILVQDYHFALAPRMIRERLPAATILTFWHIPWPNAERFGICPWREEILDGLLGSSIVGFHTHQHCNNFLEAIDTFIESRIDRELRAVVQRSRSTLVRPYPISIEWPVRRLEDFPSPEECRRDVLREHSLPSGTLIGVGVDRLDYTKGLEERLQAVDELLGRHPELRGKFVFIQLAAPSRTRIARYQDLNTRIEDVTRQINQKWQRGAYRPIILHRAHHEPDTVFRYYRAANLCYVSSLHDGMNLVAKEFVAARQDELGVLVLSQFTGAARELTEALIVNPYDLRQTSDALAVALRMSADEQAERMRSMRRLLSELNVYRWAGRMLIDAAELRRRERLSGRLARVVAAADGPHRGLWPMPARGGKRLSWPPQS